MKLLNKYERQSWLAIRSQEDAAGTCGKINLNCVHLISCAAGTNQQEPSQFPFLPRQLLLWMTMEMKEVNIQ
jgi:hypothetical protein